MIRSMLAMLAMLVCTTLALGCGPLEEGDPEEEPGFGVGGKADFVWGSGSGAGSGTLNVQFAKNKIITLGTIPAGRKDVAIAIDSAVDVDLQLIDLSDSTKVIYKSYGKLGGATRATITYRGVTVEWSGYAGDGTAGGKGREDLEIAGTTPVGFKVRIYTTAAGSATVKYQWGSSGSSGGSDFAQRLQTFKSKYPADVVVATRQGKPAIFLEAKSHGGDETAAGQLVTDLSTMIGAHTIMIWNPAGENFFHVALPDSPKLGAAYRRKSITVYDHIRFWDNTLGNFDEHPEYDEEEPSENDYAFFYDEPYHDSYQLEAQRAVALIVLTDAQLVSLNQYLDAIVDDFPATLGAASFNGGVPPYFSNNTSKTHNCTTWFTAFLHFKVSSAFDIHANPAGMMRDYTGAYGSPLAPELRALLVFNYSGTLPADGAEVPSSLPLDFGH